MHRCHRLAALAVIFSFAPAAAAQSPEPVTIGHAGTLHSEILGEDRPILVGLPAGYAQGDGAYPVLYLLDGPGHFHHTVGTMRFLAQQNRMPEMIVVGIGNTNRTRDLTPPTTADAGRFGETGGADRFLDFVERELFPFVESEFRTRPYRVLVGHSFGGLLAVHALLHRTDLFDAWISISPSLWWDNQRLLGEAESFFAGRESFAKSFYLTLGNEGGNMRPAYDQFVEIVDRTKPDEFIFGHRIMPDEDHGSVPLRSTVYGLGVIFRDWTLPAELVADGDLDGIDAHMQRLSARMKYEIAAPELLINNLGYQVMETGDVEKAIAIFRRNVKSYPGSANVYDSLGEGLETAGRLEEALRMFEKAVERGEAISDPNTDVYREHIDRVRARMKERDGS